MSSLADDLRTYVNKCFPWGRGTAHYEGHPHIDGHAIADRVEARIAQLEAALRVARCPDTDCQDGAVPIGPDPDGHWEAAQCQWCFERDALLEGSESPRPGGRDND